MISAPEKSIDSTWRLAFLSAFCLSKLAVKLIAFLQGEVNKNNFYTTLSYVVLSKIYLLTTGHVKDAFCKDCV